MANNQTTYHKEHNIFLSRGYTSAAGNSYFQGIRLSDRLIVTYDFGQGYMYLFLNGIRLYGFDGHETKLIASRSFFNQPFSESYAKRECQDLLMDYLKSQLALMRSSVTVNQIKDFAKAMIDAVGSINHKYLTR